MDKITKALLYGLAQEIESEFEIVAMVYDSEVQLHSGIDIRGYIRKNGLSLSDRCSRNYHLMNIFIEDGQFRVYVNYNLSNHRPLVFQMDEPNLKSLFEFIGKYAEIGKHVLESTK